MVGAEVAAVDRRALTEDGEGGVEGGHLAGQALVALHRLAPLVDLGLDRVEVGEGQLDLQDPEVLEGVGRPGHVGIVEGPQDVDDGVDLTDPGEELVAQALALAGALDQAPDVDELHGGGDHVLGGAHLGQGVETVVGDLGHARRWGRWWRRRTARPAPSPRTGRCRARTSPRWGDRRTRSAPFRRRLRPAAPPTLGAVASETTGRAAVDEAFARITYLLDRELAPGLPGAGVPPGRRGGRRAVRRRAGAAGDHRDPHRSGAHRGQDGGRDRRGLPRRDPGLPGRPGRHPARPRGGRRRSGPPSRATATPTPPGPTAAPPSPAWPGRPSGSATSTWS